MSKQQGGLSAEEIIRKEAIDRITDYQTSVQGMIKLNIELEKITREMATSDIKGKRKLKKEYDLVHKQREKLQVQYRKNAKVNKNIRKREGNSNISYIKQLKEINKVKKDLLRTDEKLRKSTKKSGNIFQRFSRRVKGALDPATLSAGALIGAVYGIYTKVKETIELIKKLDTIELSMKVAFDGDEIALKRTMGSLYLWSVKYGASLLTLTERYNKFVVAAKQSNITLTDTEDIFETITKAAGVMGLRNEELKGSLLAIEQMMSKGKITTEELRRQLGERMPGAMGIMAQAYDKVTRKTGDAVKSQTEMTQALDKAMKKGEVFTADVLPAFAEAMRKAYNLDSIEVIDTLTAAQERSNTAWIKMVEAIDNGHGALSKFLKLYYKAKEILSGSFTPFTEKFADREYFAKGVDDAKKYIKGFKAKYKKTWEDNTGESLLDTEENDRIIDRARTNDILKKKYALKILIKEREKQLAIEKELSINAKFRLKLGERLTEEQVKQSKAPKGYVGVWSENERLGVLEKQYEKRFREVSRLKGKLEGFNKEIKKHFNPDDDKDPIKEKLYKAKKLIKPLTKDFDKFGKSLKLILKDLADFYKDKSDKAGTYEDALDYKKSELNVRRQILDLTKRQKEADLKSNRKKELASIDAKILKNKNIAIENSNKAQSVIDKLDKNASNYEETVKRIRAQFVTANLKEYNETLKRNKEEVEKKYQYELNYATNVYIQGMNKIERKSVMDRLDIIKRLHDEELVLANNNSQIQKNELMTDLYNEYKGKVNKVKEFEEKKKDIENFYLRDKMVRELKALEETYKLAQEKHKVYKANYYSGRDGLTKLFYTTETEGNATDKELDDMATKIDNAKNSLHEFDYQLSIDDTKTQKLFSRVLAFVDTYKSVFMDMVNSIGEAIDQSYQRDIDAQDGRLDRLHKYYDKQRELAGDNALKKKLLDEEEQIAEDKIDARKKALMQKQAEAKKKFAIFNTIVNGAQAVVNILATADYPANIILAAMVTATTKVKLDMLRKQQIPEYKHGTPLGGHKKDGIALVGDGGVQEVVHEPGKKPFLTPNTPTYMYLRRKTDVYKSKSDFIKKSINKNMINSNKNDTFVIDDNGIKSAIIQGFNQSNIKNSINISIQNNNPYKSFKRL